MPMNLKKKIPTLHNLSFEIQLKCTSELVWTALNSCGRADNFERQCEISQATATPFKKILKTFPDPVGAPEAAVRFQGAACRWPCQQEMWRDPWRAWRVGNAASRRFPRVALSVLGSYGVGMDAEANKTLGTKQEQ